MKFSSNWIAIKDLCSLKGVLLAQFFYNKYRNLQELQNNEISSSQQTIRHFKVSINELGQFIYFSCSVPENKGGTYDALNLNLFKESILEATQEEKTTYIIYLNTGGVRITHDRTIFDKIWGIMPLLFKLRKKHLLISLADEKCLGAGAVFFAQSTYRIAIGEKTILNLTGPSVIRKYYGENTENQKEYSDYSSVNHQWNTNELIQETFYDLNSGIQRVGHLISFLYECSSEDGKDVPLQISKKENEKVFSKSEDEHQKLLSCISEKSFEIFPILSKIGKTYLLKKGNKIYGALLQPLKNPENTMNRKLVRRFEMALDVFKVLGIPLLTGIDSPGGDPRQSESDKDILLASVDLVEKLCSYPYQKMGVILRRSFGGSGMFALPPSHGSVCFLALKGSQIGIMSDGLIESIVQSRESLKKDWEITKNSHLPQLEDLITDGTLDYVVTEEELSTLIDLNLLDLKKQSFFGKSYKIQENLCLN